MLALPEHLISPLVFTEVHCGFLFHVIVLSFGLFLLLGIYIFYFFKLFVYSFIFNFHFNGLWALYFTNKSILEIKGTQ